MDTEVGLLAPNVVLVQDDMYQCTILLDGVELPRDLVIERVEYPQAPYVAPMIYFKPMQASSFLAVNKKTVE